MPPRRAVRGETQNESQIRGNFQPRKGLEERNWANYEHKCTVSLVRCEEDERRCATDGLEPDRSGNCEGDEMKALITDLERCSTSTGVKPLSPAQLKASLTAATAFMERWQHTVDIHLETPFIPRNRTQHSTGRQGDKPSQIL